MKLGTCLILAALGVGCASAPKAEPRAATSTTTLTSAEAPPAERWAEKKVAADVEKAKQTPPPSEPREGLDPMAVNSEIEESTIPVTVLTPPKQVRAKRPAQLNAAMNVVKSASSVDAAAKKLTLRLGKPTWMETPKNAPNSRRRVWVASVGTGAQCHRLILEADGLVEVETASKSEWRLLTATARQNPCTGEIKRGLGAGSGTGKE